MTRFLIAWALLVLGCGQANEPRFRPTPSVAELAVSVPTESASTGPSTVDDPLVVPVDEVAPNLNGAARRTTAIVVAPGDLFTSTSNTAVTIAFPHRGLTADDVADIAARYELVTWPEREVVRTELSYLDEALEHSPFSRVVLTPSVPLSNRWYALRALASEEERPASDIAPVDGRHIVSRFFPASNPILRRVLSRPRPDGGFDVEVFFSEPVRMERSMFDVALDGVVDPSCRIANPTQMAAEGGGEMLWIVCDRGTDDSAFQLLQSGTVLSASGLEVRDATGTPMDTLSIDLPSDSSDRARGATRIYVPPFGLDRGF